ncbi:hypothetical protein Bbelb_109710 [Branchiostoma belcheri]|nr:hypothetical protein Bbelb_109380 [Branchiostoma belcheri]KAI8511871.1 hypothetical protein Bbelb_109710 [Branchiostoma belcheri]
MEIGVWIRKEGTALGPSAYKWKTLTFTGNELKTAIRGLPLYMTNIIDDVGDSSQVSIDALQGPQATTALTNMGETVSLSNRNGGEDQTEIRVADIIKLWKPVRIDPPDPMKPDYKIRADVWDE